MEKEKISLSIGDMPIFAQNSPLNFDINKLKGIFHQDRIDVKVDLGAGDKSYYVYSSDLSHDYVKINAEYST
jgi:glutamate N-acetyltransferase/amino-acid N-acetyltransferase